MTPDAYKEALSKAKAQLIKAIQQREHLSLEVARLEQLVKALSVEIEKPAHLNATEEVLQTGVRLKDLVLGAVNRSALPVSALVVRSQLNFYGYDLSKYSNPMAMIHQTLKRLAEQGHIRDMGNGSYKRSALYEALLRAGETE